MKQQFCFLSRLVKEYLLCIYLFIYFAFFSSFPFIYKIEKNKKHWDISLFNNWSNSNNQPGWIKNKNKNKIQRDLTLTALDRKGKTENMYFLFIFWNIKEGREKENGENELSTKLASFHPLSLCEKKKKKDAITQKGVDCIPLPLFFTPMLTLFGLVNLIMIWQKVLEIPPLFLRTVNQAFAGWPTAARPGYRTGGKRKRERASAREGGAGRRRVTKYDVLPPFLWLRRNICQPTRIRSTPDRTLYGVD